MKTTLGFLSALFLLFLVWVTPAEAGVLTQFSDLIDSSRPATSTNHTITFTMPNAVPAGGKIVIVPEVGSVTIPAAFDFTDVDFLTATSGGPFSQRSLAGAPSLTEDGVSVTTGASGSLTITLNSATGIVAGDRGRIVLGTNATYGAVGDEQLLSTVTTGSYRVYVETRNSLDVRIDSATTMFAIIDPVGVLVTSPYSPPTRSSGLPSGLVAAGNEVIEISLRTDELATCRFATTTGVAYLSMTNRFSPTVGTYFGKTLSGFADNQTYTYYVRCSDQGGSANNDDYAITFTLKDSATSTTSVGADSGAGGPGGVGPIPGGVSILYLANVVLSGYTVPGSMVTILRDGKSIGTTRSSGTGAFRAQVSDMERGSYTFSLYVLDRANRRSATHATTLTLGQGTSNVLGNLVLPPTIALAETTVSPGETILIEGEGPPESTIEIYVNKQKSTSMGSAKKYVATTTKEVVGVAGGTWRYALSAGALGLGSYQIKARAVTGTGHESGYSSLVFVGVGESPSPDFASRADINKDGKVNLIDFSIMLTFWGSDENPDADINSDNTVNLADFSILLFNWTA
jgi:hypothetical protein